MARVLARRAFSSPVAAPRRGAAPCAADPALLKNSGLHAARIDKAAEKDTPRHPRRQSHITSLILAVLLMLWAPAASALSVPEKPQGYVNDYAGLLSSSARNQLEQTLSDLDRQTSNQIFVAIFPSLEGGSIEDFSIKLFDQWKPGTAKHDNGVLLVIFPNDRQVRIEVGYGLEGALPDALAGQIIRSEIVPAFREQRYDDGVRAAVSAIAQATRGEYKASTTESEDPFKRWAPYAYLALIFYLAVPILCYLLILGLGFAIGGAAGFLVALFLVMLLAALRKAFSTGQTFSGGSGFWGGGSSGGFGGGGFGGGFGGGGGGMGGGGGASGRW